MTPLSRGAQRCLQTLKSFLKGKDHCWPSQQKIADRMGCSLRSVKSYIEELRVFGAIISKRRPNSSCMYTLRTDFALPKKESALPVALPEVQICTSTFNTLTEEKLEDQSESTVVGASTDLAYRQAQRNSIERAVRGCGLEPNPELLGKLARKAKFYGVTGFVIAAAIDRAWRKVEGTSNTPRSLAWIAKVVETELAPASETQGCAVPGDPERGFTVGAAPPLRVFPLESLCVSLADSRRKPPQPEREIAHLLEAIEGLARSKAMGASP